MATSFIFYASFWTALKDLKPTVRCAVYDALCEYVFESKEPTLSGLPHTLFTLMRPVLDANSARRENGKLGAESGAKGGRPKKPANNPDTDNNNNPIGVISENPIGDISENPAVLSDKDKDKDIDKDIDIDDDSQCARAREGADAPDGSGESVGSSVEREAENLIKSYGERCPSLTPIKGGLTSKRRQAITALLARHKPAQVLEAFSVAEGNAFLRGGGPRGWVASFDWLIDGDHLDDVLAGKYDEHMRPTAGAAPPGELASSFDTDEFFEAALKRSQQLLEENIKKVDGKKAV